MLGYITNEARGASDALIRAVADLLAQAGLRLAGAVQINDDAAAGQTSAMALRVLPIGPEIGISQRLGALSQGCRLDPDGLERAVGLVAARLEDGADLLIVNKFGKQEGEGRGFRPLIGQALAAGIPVLTAVKPANMAGFAAFADGMADALPDDAQAIADWVRAQG